MATRTYKINHEEQTITITRDFGKRASVFGSKEHKEFKKLREAYTGYSVHYRKATVKANKRTFKGLTFEFMERHIIKFPDREKMLTEFEAVKAFHKGTPAYYARVKAWFLSNYKDYDQMGEAS